MLGCLVPCLHFLTPPYSPTELAVGSSLVVEEEVKAQGPALAQQRIGSQALKLGAPSGDWLPHFTDVKTEAWGRGAEGRGLGVSWRL